MLPWALDRTRSCLPRIPREWGRTPPVRTRGVSPIVRSQDPRAWEGKVSRLCLAPRTHAVRRTRRFGHLPADPLTARRLLRFRSARRLPATRLIFWPVGPTRRPNRGHRRRSPPRRETPTTGHPIPKNRVSLPKPLHPKVHQPRPAASPARRRSRRPPVRIQEQAPGTSYRFRALCHRATHEPRRDRAPRHDWAARRRTHTRKCASQRATRVPVFQGLTCSLRARPEGRASQGGGPRRVRRGFRFPLGNPGDRLRPDRHCFHRERGRDRDPHADPKVDLPTWIRRVRGRTA